MPKRKEKKPTQRSRLLDSIYLLLAALAVVAVIGGITAFFIAYDDAPWMPHGEGARQLFAAVFGFGFGSAYLYLTWQSRRLQRALAGKPYLRRLAALNSRWWISLAISLIAFAVGMYSLSVFLGVDGLVRAANVTGLVQILGGTVLVAGGLAMLTVTFKIRKQAKFTVSVIVFGLVLPAVLVVSGLARLVAGCWQLGR